MTNDSSIRLGSWLGTSNISKKLKPKQKNNAKVAGVMLATTQFVVGEVLQRIFYPSKSCPDD